MKWGGPRRFLRGKDRSGVLENPELEADEQLGKTQNMWPMWQRTEDQTDLELPFCLSFISESRLFH